MIVAQAPGLQRRVEAMKTCKPAITIKSNLSQQHHMADHRHWPNCSQQQCWSSAQTHPVTPCCCYWWSADLQIDEVSTPTVWNKVPCCLLQTKQCCDVKECSEISTQIVQRDVESTINNVAIPHSLNLCLSCHLTTSARTCEQKRVQKRLRGWNNAQRNTFVNGREIFRVNPARLRNTRP